MDFDTQNNIILPVLPLRGLVVFPKSMVHFDVGRKKSIEAINKAMKDNQLIFLSTQKDPAENDPDLLDLFKTGVIAKVVQVLKQPENSLRIVIEGLCRADIVTPVYDDKCLMAETMPLVAEKSLETAEDTALMRAVKKEFKEYIDFSSNMPTDIIFKVAMCKSPGELADFIASNIILEYYIKQAILDIVPETERIEAVYDILVNENFVLKIEEEVSQRARERIDQNQRE